MCIKKKLLVILAILAIAVSLISCAGGKNQTTVQAAPIGDGFETVATPSAELEELQKTLVSLDTPSGIGI